MNDTPNTNNQGNRGWSDPAPVSKARSVSAGFCFGLAVGIAIGIFAF